MLPPVFMEGFFFYSSMYCLILCPPVVPVRLGISVGWLALHRLKIATIVVTCVSCAVGLTLRENECSIVKRRNKFVRV